MSEPISTAQLGAVRLAYRTWGPEDAPPLLLLHSLGEQSTTWRNLAESLQADRYVIAPDLRGHGLSGRTESYSIDLMGDDILRLVDMLGLDPVGLVGHSLGAMVAYVLAPSAPEHIRVLVLEEPPPPDRPNEPRRLPKRDAAVECDWAAVEAVHQQRNDPSPSWGAGMAKIDASTLVIAGGPRSHLDQDEMRATAQRIPGCRFMTIPGGHFVHRRRPEEFAAAVSAFLSGDRENQEMGWSDG